MMLPALNGTWPGFWSVRDARGSCSEDCCAPPGAGALSGRGCDGDGSPAGGRRPSSSSAAWYGWVGPPGPPNTGAACKGIRGLSA